MLGFSAIECIYYRGLIFHARLAVLGLTGPLTKSGPLKAEEEGYIASKEEISVEVYHISNIIFL